MKSLKRPFRIALFLSTALLSQNALATEECDGNYKVPVADPALVDSSNYESRYKFHKTDGKITRIKYTLPVELSGEENDIDISYTGNADFPWSGENAQGDCTEVEGNFQCHLTYTKEKLYISAEKTEEAIRTKFAGNPEEIQRRLNVAEIFRSEPAGVTSFPMENGPEE